MALLRSATTRLLAAHGRSSCYSSLQMPLSTRFSSSSSRALAAPWELFPVARQPNSAMLQQAPLYLSDWRSNLEFSLEKMRLTEEPIGMQLLNRNARRPKKANHGKRPCSHHRRRLKRLGRRSSS